MIGGVPASSLPYLVRSLLGSAFGNPANAGNQARHSRSNSSKARGLALRPISSTQTTPQQRPRGHESHVTRSTGTYKLSTVLHRAKISLSFAHSCQRKTDRGYNTVVIYTQIYIHTRYIHPVHSAVTDHCWTRRGMLRLDNSLYLCLQIPEASNGVANVVCGWTHGLQLHQVTTRGVQNLSIE